MGIACIQCKVRGVRAECVGDVLCLLLSLQKLSSLLCFPLFNVFFNFFINRQTWKRYKDALIWWEKHDYFFQYGIKIIRCLSSRIFGSKTELQIFSGNLFPSVNQPIFKQDGSVHFTTVTNYFYALAVLCSKQLSVYIVIDFPFM